APAAATRPSPEAGGNPDGPGGSAERKGTILSMPERSTFEVIAIATSAGGLKALSQVLAALPHDFPPAIGVVQHLEPPHLGLMADILSRRSTLPVKQAEENDKLHPGTVYIAPPNKHLLVNPDGSVSLTQSELVHFVRPSADLLFESVAGSFKN